MQSRERGMLMADGGRKMADQQRQSPATGWHLPSAVRRLPSLALALLSLSACKAERADPPRRVLGGMVTLVPATPTPRPEADTAVFAVPADSLIPNDAMGTAIRRGRAIAIATRDSMHLDRSGALRCVSCHLDAGTKRGALPWVGAYARYPRVDARGGVQTVHERVNVCLRRNLRAPTLRPDHPQMEALVAYIAFLSRGVRLGGQVEGQGDDTVTVRAGIAKEGATVWKEHCIACHGTNGQGTPKGGPVWGRRSFTTASELASWATFAGFLRGHMSDGGRRSLLTDQEVANVTSFVLRQARLR
ncbi:MAG: c-type cytochrome [Gemmatimonadaceae bacterium]|jgi:thiosulfate dehydrogenase